MFEKFLYCDHAWLLAAMVNATANPIAGEEFCLQPLGWERVMLLIEATRTCIQLNLNFGGVPTSSKSPSMPSPLIPEVFELIQENLLIKVR